MNLETFFKNHNKIALAFSGGTDSSYLLYAALKYGCDVRPYFVKSAFQPEFELDDAKRLCTQLGADLRVIELDVLADATIASNPEDRCYYCKRAIFSALIAAVKADGYSKIMDGTNASDDPGDRPGTRALRELEVLSPLRECGITKADIRKLSQEAGLFTWEKPAYACLATRIPANTPISDAALKAVENSEDALFKMGFSDLRVRVIGRTAKIQLPENQLEGALNARADIVAALTKYFDDVTLDLNPR